MVSGASSILYHPCAIRAGAVDAGANDASARAANMPSSRARPGVPMEGGHQALSVLRTSLLPPEREKADWHVFVSGGWRSGGGA